jgi:hypothetical protein
MSDRCEPPEHLRGVDGDHWLSCADTPITAYWYADVARWTIRRLDRIDPEAMPGWRYHSPVATPAEVEALRREAAKFEASWFDAVAERVAAEADVATLCAANARLREAIRSALDAPIPSGSRSTTGDVVFFPVLALARLRAALQEPTP